VIGVAGGVQPELLPDLADEGCRRDGFVERILWEYPDCATVEWIEDTIDEAHRKQIVDLLRTLRQGASDRPIRMDVDARRTWRSWYDNNARATGIAAGIYAKLPNQLARLALIHHCMTYPDAPSSRLLSGETLADAIELVEYYRRMADRVIHHFSALPANGTAGLVGRIGHYLRREGRWVKTSEINKHLGGHVSSEGIQNALWFLFADDRAEHGKVTTAGRPSREWRWQDATAERAEKGSAPPGSEPTTTCGRSGRSHRRRRGDVVTLDDIIEALRERDAVLYVDGGQLKYAGSHMPSADPLRVRQELTSRFSWGDLDGRRSGG
jgi:hypothetical protein